MSAPGDEAPANTMDLTVCVVSFNAADALKRCLAQVTASAFPGAFEVVVVDNGSTDGSAEVAHTFPAVRVLEPGTNLFYSGGNNLGWNASQSSYFLILNSDCYVNPDTLATVFTYLEDHPDVGAATVRMTYESGELQHICARFQDRWYSLLWYTAVGGLLPRSRARAKSRLFYEGWDRTTTRSVEVAPDSFLMVRRAAVVGDLYDEAMALYFTEDELCRRLAAGRWRVDYVAEATVVHPEGTSTSREPSARIRAIFLRDLRAYYARFEPRWYWALMVGALWSSELLRRARPRPRTAAPA